MPTDLPKKPKPLPLRMALLRIAFWLWIARLQFARAIRWIVNTFRL